jgi:hypothetical protein
VTPRWINTAKVADDDTRDIIFDKVVVNRGDTPILKRAQYQDFRWKVDGDYRSSDVEVDFG